MNAKDILEAAFHVLCEGEPRIPFDARELCVWEKGEAEEWLRKIATGDYWLDTHYSYRTDKWSPALGGY